MFGQQRGRQNATSKKPTVKLSDNSELHLRGLPYANSPKANLVFRAVSPTWGQHGLSASQFTKLVVRLYQNSKGLKLLKLFWLVIISWHTGLELLNQYSWILTMHGCLTTDQCATNSQLKAAPVYKKCLFNICRAITNRCQLLPCMCCTN